MHSDGYWRVIKRTGRNEEVVATGAAPSLRTGYLQWNYVLALAVGDYTAFYLNGQWMQVSGGLDIFPLGPGTDRGWVDIITAYISGTEREGAITHYENFRGRVLESSSVSEGTNMQDLMAHVEAEYQGGPPSATESSTGHRHPAEAIPNP